MACFPTQIAAAVLAIPLLLGAAPAPGDLQVELSNLRNAKGILLLCLSGAPKHFPNCGSDPAARMIKVPAGRTDALIFAGVAPGDYALSVMHDENGNAKLDTTMTIPREGFGFSRNPVVRFGPPKYRDVAFVMPAQGLRMPIKMRYFL